MTDNKSTQSLPEALLEAEREKEAVREKFKHETGADAVSITEGQLATEVTLRFNRYDEKLQPEATQVNIE